jgi:hypothetical protein
MPKGTSRQVKPHPKHSKGKHTGRSGKPGGRSRKLGGTRSHRLHQARTQHTPHLQSGCLCPCPQQPPPAPEPPDGGGGHGHASGDTP